MQRTISIMICLLVALTLPAFAEPLNQETLDEAEAHFFQGVQQYRAGKFEAAARAFQKAFALTENRTLLYNVARTHERLGSKEAAIAWYQAYLRTQPADETGVVHRVKLLGGDGAGASSSGGRKKVIRRAVALETLQPIGYRWMKWGLLGAGVSSLAIGTALGLQASSEEDKAKDAEGTIAAEQWTRQADRSAFGADVFFLAGGLTLGTAAYFFISEALEDGEAAAFVPNAHGGSFVYRASF